MHIFTSIELQRQTGVVQRAASREGAVITSHGKPRNVILSGEEYCRLKQMAREPVPSELMPRKSVVIRPAPDPLGYDATTFHRAAQHMAGDAIRGAGDDAVRSELDRVRDRFAASR
nr:type II toxin-antitoxin system prevent-host-death family antitoxin [uncultured Gellertiella sp.]